MGVYAATTDVLPLIAGRPLTETSSPSLDDVDAWITEAEAEVLGALASVGVATSYAPGSVGAIALRSWIADYVSGRVRRQHAGGEAGNEDGQYEIDYWRERMRAIFTHPSQVGGALDPSGAAPSATHRAASHIDDPALGLREEDFAPSFRVKGVHY